MQPLERRQGSPPRSIDPLKQVLPFIGRYRTLLVLAAIALTGAAATTLAIPVAVRRMIDLGFVGDTGRSMNSYFIALGLLACALAVFTAARFYFVSSLGERAVADIRTAVCARLIPLSPSFFETNKTGELLSRLTTDTTLVEIVIGSSASVAIRNLLLLIGGFAMLLVTSPRLTGWILLLIPLVLVPIIVFGRRLRRLSRVSQDRIADISAIASEVFDGIQTVQAFNQESREQQRFHTAATRALAAALTRIRARALLTAAVISMVFSAVVAILWMGAHSVVAGDMTAGQLSQFILYAVLVAGATGALSEVWGDVQRAAGAMARIAELLHQHPDIQAPPDPQALPRHPSAAVRLDGVSFSYPSRPHHLALSRITVDIAAGQTVALVGPSGGGKSTLFHLLLRFYDPTEGHIYVNDRDIKRVDPAALRAQIGLVPQHPIIFAGNALDNIRYGCPDASHEDIQQAARLALAHEFIEELPEGYETFLGERGARLSGGQRQRIAIARAILKDPPLLLLDEATSALDAQSEHLIQRALTRAMAYRTTLVIAHRLATVQRADRILVLDQGRVVAQGTHAQLLAGDGLYQRLAALQFGAPASTRDLDMAQP